MTKTQFINLVDEIVEIYGVYSYHNNDEEDDYWFQCPNDCDEPILFEDYGASLEIEEDEDGRFVICPICESRIDLN